MGKRVDDCDGLKTRRCFQTIRLCLPLVLPIGTLMSLVRSVNSRRVIRDTEVDWTLLTCGDDCICPVFKRRWHTPLSPLARSWKTCAIAKGSRNEGGERCFWGWVGGGCQNPYQFHARIIPCTGSYSAEVVSSLTAAMSLLGVLVRNTPNV